jgi:hypothetical protein
MTRERGFDEEVEARYKTKNKIKKITLPPVELLLKMAINREVDRVFRNHKERNS